MKSSSEKNTFDSFPDIGALMVSKMIVDENFQPRFLYREKRMDDYDSGWRIFTGFESEEYSDNPDNIGLYDAVTILNIDSSLQDILLKGIGSVYEKAEDNSGWNKVTDFELEDDYMVDHTLTSEWTIKINNLFERSVEEHGELLYTTGDKSVRLVIWNEEGNSKDVLYSDYAETIQNRDQSPSPTLNTYDFSDDLVLRIGYLIREKNTGKSYHVLFGFSIIDQEVLQSAIYFDEKEDLNWAINTWKSIQIS